MSSGGHPGLASCVSLPDTVLSGSSDSNNIRLCGPSHGILLVLSGISAYALSSVSSSAWRFLPPGWRGSGPYRFSVNSIPESIVFRASFPVHVGRMRFVSIQSLSGGRPVVGKFWFSLEDDPTRLVISNPSCLLGSLLDLFSILVTGTNCNKLGGGQLDSDATGVGLSGFPKEQQTHSGDGI